MEHEKKHQTYSRLPHTSRVGEKIMEYYMKFGKERDLEKYMRLYSPAGSRQSHNSRSPVQSTATTTSISSFCVSEDGVCGGGETFRRLFYETTSDLVMSKSLPNIDKTEEKIVEIPIRLEGGGEEKETATSSSEEGPTITQTPEQKELKATKETQTPDSAIKSHRRLEWDSLGDVGYKKSMSTSNISILERAILKEFFQESTTTSSSTSHKLSQTNASADNVQKLQKNPHTRPKEQKYQTPPLASSTFAEVKISKTVTSCSSDEKVKERPRHGAQGTCTSLLKQFEKQVQTTLQKPERTTFGVQVNISSRSGSAVCSSATPSSFEYCSSRSSYSQATSNGSSKKPHAQAPHPFIAGITEMLARRNVLSERNSQSEDSDAAQLQQLHDTLKKAFSENKENSSTTSLLRSPQLDLGVQLLCSLIDAKSLNNKQKKKLVRDIIKRLSMLSTSSSSEPIAQRSTSNSSIGIAKEPRSEIQARKQAEARQQEEMEAMNMKSVTSNLPEVERQSNAARGDRNLKPREKERVSKKHSAPETSVRAVAQLKARNAQPPVSSTAAQVPKVAPPFEGRSAKPTEKFDEVDSELKIEISNESADEQNEEITSKTTHSPPDATYRRSTPPQSAITTTNSTSSSSKDLTTQKFAHPHAVNANNNNNNNTDAEQPTMREWLNPLTQSEIEYEERKAALAKNANKRDQMREQQNLNSDKERTVQLNWIEKEIIRLESLRNLLLKESSSTSNDAVAFDSARKGEGGEQTSEKVYDTVCSSGSASATASSSVLSASAERLVHEIEVIIEESKEDEVDLNENVKRTKERKRETQIFYDRPKAEKDYIHVPQGEARFRKVRETITTKEDQVLRASNTKQDNPPRKASTLTIPITVEVPNQRSKMATPPLASTDDNESVRSFAQQRKREFMQHYKNKRKQQQAAMQEDQQPPQETSDHYSVPLAMPADRPPPPPPNSVHMATSGGSQNQPQQSTSSSMLGVSSEMSVPLGSHDASTTPTTTHQYDDVAATATQRSRGVAVAVQTSDSLLRTRPIFGPLSDNFWNMPHHTQSTSSTAAQTACVQVKPKGIAYIIQFDKKSKPKSTTSTTSTTSAARPTAAAATRTSANASNTSSSTTSTSNTTTSSQPPQPPQPSQLTLQQHLQRGHPQFLAQSEERKAILNQLQALRQEREREMREIIDNVSLNSLEQHLNELPPPATKQLRIFGTKEMKAMTNKRCQNLPEVVARQQTEREERWRRGNRVLRDVFNRRLQRRVRSGMLSLNHSKTVI